MHVIARIPFLASLFFQNSCRCFLTQNNTSYFLKLFKGFVYQNSFKFFHSHRKWSKRITNYFKIEWNTGTPNESHWSIQYPPLIELAIMLEGTFGST
jgi:hypothetical protein